MCLHDGTKASSIGIDADRHDFVVRNSNVSSLLDVIQSLFDGRTSLIDLIANESSRNSTPTWRF